MRLSKKVHLIKPDSMKTYCGLDSNNPKHSGRLRYWYRYIVFLEDIEHCRKCAYYKKQENYTLRGGG